MLLPKQQGCVYGPYPRPDPQSPVLPFLLLETLPLIPVEEERVPCPYLLKWVGEHTCHSQV